MKICFLIPILFISALLHAQSAGKYNFSSASHPMTVDKIEFNDEKTIVWLSLENQAETGYFCADKNIYIIDIINNKKLKLIKSQGIPVCPETYYFKSVGEVLSFQLIFPKMSPQTKFINIIEDCNQNCFSIKGIVVDADINKEINMGYDNYASGKADLALAIFRQFPKKYPDYPYGIIYFNIIHIFAETKDITSAKTWYKALLNSNVLDKNEVISRLKQQYYYPQLVL